MLLCVTGVKKPSNATALRNYTFHFITFSTVTQTVLTPPCEPLLLTVSLKKKILFHLFALEYSNKRKCGARGSDRAHNLFSKKKVSMFPILS
jgi:hypothetical protein